MAQRHWMIGAGIAGLAGAVALALIWSAKPPNTPPPFKGEIQAFAPTVPPKEAIELVATDGSGQKLLLGDRRGKVVLINFWATWCAPCVDELPALQRLATRLKDENFELIALSSDRGGKRIVEPFLAKLELGDLPIQLDESGVTGRAYAVRGLPTSILIDAEGREVGRLEGTADWDGDAALALIRYYLKRAD